MKKTSMVLVFVSTALFMNSAFSVQAISLSIRHDNRNTITRVVENENEISITPRQFKKETKETEISDKPKEKGILNQIKNFIKKNFKFEARIQGIISSKGTNSLSEKGNDGKTYLINISDKTKLIREFGGKSSLAEFTDGDKIMVFGKFTDSSKGTIDANIIRNLSIQKRWGAFFGKVTILNSDNFVMTTVERGTQTVYFSSTKFVNRKEVSMTYGDVKVGDRVRIKGVWDKTLNKINEVTQVKDFSLPIIIPT